MILSRTQLPTRFPAIKAQRIFDKGTGLWWRVRSGEHERRDKEVLVLG